MKTTKPVQPVKTTLLTLQQAAAQSGIPYTSLRDTVLKGFLPRVRVGDSKRIWIRQADLDNLIARAS